MAKSKRDKHGEAAAKDHVLEDCGEYYYQFPYDPTAVAHQLVKDAIDELEKDGAVTVKREQRSDGIMHTITITERGLTIVGGGGYKAKLQRKADFINGLPNWIAIVISVVSAVFAAIALWV
jgi:hypothetical protein